MSVQLSRRAPLLVLLLLLLHHSSSSSSSYSIPCTNSTVDECERLVYNGSVCLPSGVCSNPFQQGCLYTLLNEKEDDESLLLDQDGDSDRKWERLLKKLKAQRRVCNSEDTEDDYCSRPTEHHRYSHLRYNEIRIHSQDWESSFFNAWILQILLSEVLSVPVSIETGLPHVQNSFYDATNALGYGQQNHWQTLYHADRAPEGDCQNVERYIYKKSKDQLEYQPCAHVIAEYWSDGSSRNTTHGIKYMEERGLIERPQALGAVADQGLYVTKFTAEQDPSILSYLGLQNRPQLAALFHRPTTWGDYCDLVSNTSCFLPDDTAHRPPHTDEANRFHVPGLYRGYFRATEANDCEVHPTNCTGHVGDYPCDFGSLLQPWIHHHNLPLSSDGRSAKHSYTSHQVSEMWDAANATRSNLMTLWYTPEGVHSKYVGTDTEMIRVTFPTATQECMDHRISIHNENSCLLDEAPVGDPRGACDYFPFTMQAIKSSALRTASEPEGVAEALHSPAHRAVSGYRISHLQLDQILRNWQDWSSSGYRRDGFDPRLATCQWVHDNLEDLLEDVVPDTYPRVLSEQNRYDMGLYTAALLIGSLAIVLCLISGLFVWIRRDTMVMKHAQIDFLMCLLLGVLLVSLAAVATALDPTDALCVANVWLIELGYTLELVPLIVKVTAINKLLSAAKKMKRVQINRKALFAYVAGWTVFTIVGMSIWTIFDPPRQIETFFLSEEQNDYGETVVYVEKHCGSEQKFWLMGAMVFHFLLLMWAAVLAFQTRGIHQKFNESKVLVAVIYAQCLVLAVRFALLVMPEDAISPLVDTGLTSLCLGLDSLVTLLIYFIPKLTIYYRVRSSRRESAAQPKVYSWPQTNTQTNTHSHDGSSDEQSSDRLHRSRRRTAFKDQEAHANGVIAELRKQIEEEKNVATTLVSELRTENALLNDEITVLQESNDTLTHRVEQLEKETISLREQLPPDEEEVTLQGHNNALTSRVAELEGQIASLEERAAPDVEGTLNEEQASNPESVPPDEEDAMLPFENGGTRFFDEPDSECEYFDATSVESNSDRELF